MAMENTIRTRIMVESTVVETETKERRIAGAITEVGRNMGMVRKTSYKLMGTMINPIRARIKAKKMAMENIIRTRIMVESTVVETETKERRIAGAITE